MVKKNLLSKIDTSDKFQKILSNNTSKTLYPFFIKIFYENKLSLSIISILSSINAILATAILIISYKIFNNLFGIHNKDSSLSKIENYLSLIERNFDYNFLLLIIIILYFVVLIFNVILSSNLITKFLLSYKKKIINKTLKINLQYFYSKNAGDITYVYQACVNRCASYPTQISKMIYNIFLFITLNLILYQISKILYFNLLFIVIIVLLLYTIISKFSIFYNKKYLELYNKTNTKIYELIDSIKLIVQIKNKKNYETQIYNEIEETNSFVKKYYVFTNIINNIFNYIFLILLIALIYYANFNEIENVNLLITFGFSSLILVKVVQSLLQNFTSLLNFSVNFNEIQRILELKEIKKIDKNKIIKINSINIKNVNFKYDGDKDLLLKNLSCDFDRGKSYLIYGKSGTGKTTLFNLIFNFLELQTGRILINNKKNISEVLSEIGYVTQDHFFINDTIFKNLKLFKNDLTNEDAKKILNFVNLKLNLNKLVGNQGKKLSGGQKSKLTLARCLLNKPQILLIDESLSSIDSRSRKIIIKNLNKIKKDMIQIFISHEFYKDFSFTKKFYINDGHIYSK